MIMFMMFSLKTSSHWYCYIKPLQYKYYMRPTYVCVSIYQVMYIADPSRPSSFLFLKFIALRMCIHVVWELILLTMSYLVWPDSAWLGWHLHVLTYSYMSVCVCCFCHSVDFLPGSQTSVIICDESLRHVSLEMNCYIGGISWVVLLQ